MEVVECSPPYDTAEITALIAGGVCRVDDAPNVSRLAGLEASPDGISGAFSLESGLIRRLDEWK